MCRLQAEPIGSVQMCVGNVGVRRSLKSHDDGIGGNDG